MTLIEYQKKSNKVDGKKKPKLNRIDFGAIQANEIKFKRHSHYQMS